VIILYPFPFRTYWIYLSGLAIVGVTEPLALPWVALGTVTPFILGYRLLGGEVVASNAPEFINQPLRSVIPPTKMITISSFIFTNSTVVPDLRNPLLHFEHP
jgi:hypothetical protein